jgi:ABC-2 type transport system ATP-binding protein
MVTQVHLAIVMAIDAKLLVLDEPTLGLDLLYRKQFYDALIDDYFERSRTVIVATHQIEEVQHVLTDVLCIDRGRIVLNRSVEDIETGYQEVLVHPDKLAPARALGPIAERQGVGHSVLIFEQGNREQLATLGEVRTPTIADLFVAVMSNRAGEHQGVAP